MGQREQREYFVKLKPYFSIREYIIDPDLLPLFEWERPHPRDLSPTPLRRKFQPQFIASPLGSMCGKKQPKSQDWGDRHCPPPSPRLHPRLPPRHHLHPRHTPRHHLHPRHPLHALPPRHTTTPGCHPRHHLRARVHIVVPAHRTPSTSHGYRASLQPTRHWSRVVVVLHFAILLLYKN